MIVSIAYIHAGALYSHLAVYHVVNSASATQELNSTVTILEAITALIRSGTETT